MSRELDNRSDAKAKARERKAKKMRANFIAWEPTKDERQAVDVWAEKFGGMANLSLACLERHCRLTLVFDDANECYQASLTDNRVVFGEPATIIVGRSGTPDRAFFRAAFYFLAKAEGDWDLLSNKPDRDEDW